MLIHTIVLDHQTNRNYPATDVQNTEAEKGQLRSYSYYHANSPDSTTRDDGGKHKFW